MIDAAEAVSIAGLENAHGLGISQVVPSHYSPTLPVVREYQTLLKRSAPSESFTYASFEGFLSAEVLVEGLRRAGPSPTRAKLMTTLENISSYDMGGVKVGCPPTNRVGSRFVEVTVVGPTGKLMK